MAEHTENIVAIWDTRQITPILSFSVVLKSNIARFSFSSASALHVVSCDIIIPNELTANFKQKTSCFRVTIYSNIYKI